MLKGAIHIHSTYSDGEFTLSELRQLFTTEGCAFVCLTDHAEAFDEEKLGAYVRECEALSDDRFRFIAGLEYECQERMHILGFGVTALAGTEDPQEVIRHIGRHGGVSVIAHPMDRAFGWIETFETLPDGIETWNSKYDGRYAPRADTFQLLARLQARRPELRAFYGMDLHWRKQYRGLFNLVRGEALARAEVLAAFAEGDYTGLKGDLSLPSDGRLPGPLLASFQNAHARSDRLRQVVKRVKRATKRLGLSVPAPLKAQLRRIF